MTRIRYAGAYEIRSTNKKQPAWPSGTDTRLWNEMFKILSSHLLPLLLTPLPLSISSLRVSVEFRVQLFRLEERPGPCVYK